MPPKQQSNLKQSLTDSSKVKFNKGTAPYAVGKFIDIQDIKVNTKYAFTINPSDDHQYWNAREHRSVEFEHYCQTVLDQLQFHYKLYLEISGAGRLHWHGWIWFESPKEILIFYLYQVHHFIKHNMIKMSTITDEHKWETYCTKQHEIMKVIISSDQSSERILAKSQRPSSKDINPTVFHTMDRFTKDIR